MGARPPMRQKAREVTDRAVVRAMLARFTVMHLGIHGDPYPYVVPLNFGCEWGDGPEDPLTLYFHCARRGHKLELLARNPRVCATFSSFVSYAGASRRGHLHDYRSVIARGVARPVDPEKEPEAFRRGMALLLAHNGRDPGELEGAESALSRIALWRIDCRPEDVSAKAEIPPKTPEEVPFFDGPADGAPLDESHILDD